MAVVILLFSLPASSALLGFNNIYVVGDSLSDTGNVFHLLGGATTEPPFTDLIPSAAYSSGRLSNGPVWVEQLASRLGLDVQASLIGGTGYAYGGARTGAVNSLTPSLTEQAKEIVNLPGRLQSDALYIVWGGSNDVRDAAATANPTQAGLIIQDTLNNIGGVISSLAGDGATRFLVPNLPDLSISPALQAADPLTKGFFSQLSLSFNENLTSILLPSLEASLQINITEFDFESLANNIIANPNDFGLTNTTDHCIQLGGEVCSNPDDYLFWDGIHPTTAGHTILGDQAFAALIPIPAALPLFMTGFFILGFYSRRRKSV